MYGRFLYTSFRGLHVKCKPQCLSSLMTVNILVMQILFTFQKRFDEINTIRNNQSYIKKQTDKQ